MTTALLSVSDKTGILDLARSLHQRGVRLLSTGGTARLLAESGLPVTEVSEVTGFPEMLDGRVKTLHPRIHGGLLVEELFALERSPATNLPGLAQQRPAAKQVLLQDQLDVLRDFAGGWALLQQ